MPTIIRRTLLTTTTLLPALLASCNTSSSAPAEPAAPPPPLHTASTVVTPATSQPLGAHWVRDQQLRQVMARLALQKPSVPSNLSQEPGSPKAATPEDFDTVALLASELMTSVEQIPNVAKTLQMQEADRTGFLAEARTLRDQAQRLRDAARQQRVDQMQHDMDAINATCISCHSRYRDFAGQLNTTQTLLTPAFQKFPRNATATQ